MSDTVQYIENKDTKVLSRYHGIRYLINEDNKAIQETWCMDVPELRDDDIFYEVPSGYAHRPDLIAEDVYETPDLYWLIGFASGMIDATAETYTGRKLRLPSVDYAYQLLQRRK